MRHVAARIGLTYVSTLTTPTFNGRPILSNTSFTPVLGLDPSVGDRSAEVEPLESARILETNGALYRTVCEQFGRGALGA